MFAETSRQKAVWDPYEITLLSNLRYTSEIATRFETPMKLHCSQTAAQIGTYCKKFETPMKLHCSQTQRCLQQFRWSLRPLWNYTALKLWTAWLPYPSGLRPLWNYTALKRDASYIGLTLVWDPYEITLLSNLLPPLKHFSMFETPMKLHCSQTNRNIILKCCIVWDPYEITLLSNSIRKPSVKNIVWDPYEITLLSNLRLSSARQYWVWDPYEITLLSNPGVV